MDQKRSIRAGGSNNPSAFLPAMLQRKQAVISKKSRVRVTVHGEDATFVRRFMRNLHKFGSSDSALNRKVPRIEQLIHVPPDNSLPNRNLQYLATYLPKLNQIDFVPVGQEPQPSR